MFLKIYDETLRVMYSDCCGVEGGYRPGCDCRKCKQNSLQINLEVQLQNLLGSDRIDARV